MDIDVSYSEPRMTTSERIRLRLREEMQARHISQRGLADRLTRATRANWRQAKVGKILGGQIELKVDDLDAIATCVGISLVEAVRDRGLEFFAEMTPTEVRILERMRQHGPAYVAALMTLLNVPGDPVKRPRK